MEGNLLEFITNLGILILATPTKVIAQHLGQDLLRHELYVPVGKHNLLLMVQRSENAFLNGGSTVFPINLSKNA